MGPSANVILFVTQRVVAITSSYGIQKFVAVTYMGRHGGGHPPGRRRIVALSVMRNSDREEWRKPNSRSPAELAAMRPVARCIADDRVQVPDVRMIPPPEQNDSGDLATQAARTAEMLEPPQAQTPLSTPDPKHHLSTGRVRRAALTWSAGTIYTVVTMAVAFVTTPLLIKYLGDERLGASRATMEWIGYLSLIEFGASPALGFLLMRAQVSQVPGARAAVVRSGARLLSAVVPVMLLLGGVLAWQMPRLVRLPPQMHHELIFSTLIVAMTGIFLPANVFRMALEVDQRGYMVHFALLLQAMIVAGLGVFMAFRGFGLIGQSLALFLGGLACNLMMVLTAWPSIRGAAAQKANGVHLKELWKLSWPLALSNLNGRLNMLTDNITTAYILGPSTVVVLFATQRMVMLFGGQVNGIVNASWAALTELRTSGQQALFVSRILELLRLVVGVGVTLTGTVVAFNCQFVRLWVGSSKYGGDFLSILAGLITVLMGVTLVFSWALDAGGNTAARIPVSVAGAVLNLVLSIILAKTIGLLGILLGTVIAYALTDSWFCPYQVCKLYHVPGGPVVGAIVGGAARGLPWALVAWFVARRYPQSSWIGFGALTCVMGSLSLTYCWLLVLDSHERRRWAARVPARFRFLSRARRREQEI